MSLARRASALFAAAALLLAGTALAQAPFDMSGERGELPGDTGLPLDVAPPGGAGPAPDGEAPAPFPPPGAERPAEAHAAREGRIDRYIVSAPTLRFEGEMAQRSWGVALTAEQARHVESLIVTYNSSIFVAPESSRLRVTVNERLLVEEPLSAREASSRIRVPVPPNVLRAGTNVVRFDLVQRHRTDCTVQSTYELWTDIDSAGTGLVFDTPAAGGFASIGDLAAVGFDDGGLTRLRLVLPGWERGLPDPAVLQLVQAVALRGNFRQPVVEIAETPAAVSASGTLQIAVGTARDLATLPGLPGDAHDAPTVALVSTAGHPPTLILSGPDRSGVASAIAYVVESVAHPPGWERTLVDTTPTLLPQVPMLYGERSLSFADLAVPVEEFSGRRYHAEFYVALPGDFYAEAYGEATLLLDAAYTDEVKAGSHIDVYVNGFIAANLPLTSDSGDIFQHLPVKVALTNFRPGVNRVTVEAILDTDTDAVCAPGSSAGGPSRFVVFDSSEFRMPDFARMGRWPSLSALVGTGSPYAAEGAPLQVVLGRSDPAVYGAAATMLARIGIAAGRVLPAEFGRLETVASQPALLVGAIDQFPPRMLAELGIDETSRNDWSRVAPVFPDIAVDVDPGAIVPTTFGASREDEGLYDRWRREIVNPTGLRGAWHSFEAWLERTFDLSMSSLWPSSGQARMFKPSGRSSLVVAQAPADSDRLWTLVAAPTEEALTDGVDEIVSRRFWPAMNGRIATFDRTSGVATVPADSHRFMFDGGLSLGNVRLVAANWLSVNIVPYALALVVLCIVLGVCTSALLSRLGRRS